MVCMHTVTPCGNKCNLNCYSSMSTLIFDEFSRLNYYIHTYIYVRQLTTCVWPFGSKASKAASCDLYIYTYIVTVKVTHISARHDNVYVKHSVTPCKNKCNFNRYRSTSTILSVLFSLNSLVLTTTYTHIYMLDN